MDEHHKIAEGDIVDHKFFGLGKVKAVNDHGYCNAKGSVKGYPVTVSWDDPDRSENTVMSWALKIISSPDARPFVFWDKQWQPLRENWLSVRREVEEICKTFDPAPDMKMLQSALDAEAAAWSRMQDFINALRS